jgi:hypothetical protein
MQKIQESFDKLAKERAPLVKKRDALSAERDAGIADGTLTVKRDTELVAAIKAANNALYPLDVQYAALARALPNAKSLNTKG